jgi:hypothetical protein
MAIKSTRMQVTLDPQQHRRAAGKAEALGVSLGEYLRRVVAADLDETSDERGDISEIFGIGDSGGSDIARHKDRDLGDAIAADAGTARGEEP